MSNIVFNAYLPPVMKPAPFQPAGPSAPATPPNNRNQGGLFDQFLTQAEKDFLANQLQQVKWSR
ncbi:MAG: hypothetical protein HQL91_06205 [Magnetococcales bacterium]|nr:hypothetical protein [Magnetococcales bacterium]